MSNPVNTDNKPVVTVLCTKVYGKQLIYPKCERAILFAQIANQVSLTENTLKGIKALGYHINVTHPEVNL